MLATLCQEINNNNNIALKEYFIDRIVQNWKCKIYGTQLLILW